MNCHFSCCFGFFAVKLKKLVWGLGWNPRVWLPDCLPSITQLVGYLYFEENQAWKFNLMPLILSTSSFSQLSFILFEINPPQILFEILGFGDLQSFLWISDIKSTKTDYLNITKKREKSWTLNLLFDFHMHWSRCR